MNFKTLARHGRVHHEEAYHANLGPGDKYYAIPSTSCRFCSSCAVYIGHHSLEDHALNARHIEGLQRQSNALDVEDSKCSSDAQNTAQSTFLRETDYPPDEDDGFGDDPTETGEAGAAGAAVAGAAVAAAAAAAAASAAASAAAAAAAAVEGGGAGGGGGGGGGSARGDWLLRDHDLPFSEHAWVGEVLLSVYRIPERSAFPQVCERMTDCTEWRRVRVVGVTLDDAGSEVRQYKKQHVYFVVPFERLHHIMSDC